MDFNNSAYKYNVKHIDKKVKGKVAFDSPGVKPRVPHPEKLCYKGLKKLAEIALNVRKSTQGPAPRLNDRNGQNLSRLSINKS